MFFRRENAAPAELREKVGFKPLSRPGSPENAGDLRSRLAGLRSVEEHLPLKGVAGRVRGRHEAERAEVEAIGLPAKAHCAVAPEGGVALPLDGGARGRSGYVKNYP